MADKIPTELRRIVEFLNQQMDPAEVLAVKIKQYTGQGLKTLVPRVFGQIEKSTPVSGPSQKGEAYRAFFQSLIDNLRINHPSFTQAKVWQPQNWYSFASGFSGISYSLFFAQGGRIRTEVYIDRGDADPNKAIFDALAGQKNELSDKFEEELEWERLNDRRASRIAVYRTGTIEDDRQRLADTMDWTVSRLLRLKEVFGPRLGRLIS